MEKLICHCPRTGQPVEMTFEIDGDSLARVWSKPLRFHCPHCGGEHESKVGATYVENVLAANGRGRIRAAG